MNKQQDLNAPGTEVIDYDMEEEQERILNPGQGALMGTEPVGHKRINSFVAPQDNSQVIQSL
jgi:hypothetical protein